MASQNEIGSLELLYSSSEFEDYQETPNNIQPFMYEPEVSASSDESGDHSGSESDDEL